MAAGFVATVDGFTEGLARICGIYGVNPLYGRLYGVLFLSAEAVALDDLADHVGAAKSTVSVAIRKLVDARVVRRSWRKGDRRDWYEASTEPQQVMRDLLDRYVRPELDIWERIGREVNRALEGALDESWPPIEQRRELARRLTEMQRFVEAWQRALASVEADITPAPARRIPVEFDR
jgi:DNA-binding transcriptional regulator GbsR (MarR family)